MKGLHPGHCLIGAVLVVVLVALGVPAKSFVLVLALAACPLMVVVMMRTMMGGGKGMPGVVRMPGTKLKRT